MKYNYIFLLSFFVSLNSASAGYLSLEDKEDRCELQRVANNVIDFWTVNSDGIEIVSRQLLEKEEGKKFLESIKQSKTGIAQEFRKKSKKTKADLLETFDYITKNEEKVIRELGEQKYQIFRNGLILLNHLSAAL